jgi:nucleoside-diphosphate-sugar epimerase
MLVFGVGYIGSRLVQELLYQACDVVGVDNLFATDRRAIEGFCQAANFRFVEGSITDRSIVRRAVDLAGEVASVFLLAAQASAHPDAASVEYTEEANLRGPRIILEALAERQLRNPVVYASSTLVYGSPLPAVVDESTPYGTFRDYAHLSKCYVEKLLEMFAVTHRLTTRVVRLGLTYGVAPVMKTDQRFMTAPNLFCLRATRGEPLEVRSADPLGVIHVEDAMQALLKAAEFDQPGYLAFNAVTNVTTVGELADLVRQAAAAREIEVTIRELARGEPSRPRPVIRSVLDKIGFVQRRNLAQGIDETFDHFFVHGQ